MKCFYQTFVQGSTTVILLNLRAKNPPHRQAAAHYRQFYRTFPITSALRTQFSWTHYKTLISIDSEDKEIFTLQKRRKITGNCDNWSRFENVEAYGKKQEIKC